MSKYHIYLTDEDQRLIVESLIDEKNSLVLLGKFTDGVDEVLIKILKATLKKVRVKYI